MPKVVNTELLDQIGRPNEMVDEMLDKRIDALETELGLRTKGVGNRVLGMFLVNGTRVQLSENSIQRELERQIDIDEATTKRVIKELSEAGILRITSGGRYEIANSFLAQRANQKVESEIRVLRTIRATIQDRMSRDELLDRQYLDYIGTSLPLIDLTEEEQAFIKRSREKVRKRRQLINLLIFAGFVMLAALVLQTYRNYQRAESNVFKYKELTDELTEAREQEERLRKEAEEAQLDAEAARLAAERAQGEAELAQENAEANAREANRQRILADSLRRVAVLDRNQILLQAQELEKLNEQTRMEAERNRALREQAEASELLAQQALNRAEKLNDIITSWNAAARSLEIEDARTKALVTLQAYQLNRDNPEVGNVDHPTIVRALIDAAKAMDENLSYGLPAAHQGSVRDIVIHPDGERIYTTGSDGSILLRRISRWNALGVPDIASMQDFASGAERIFNLLSISPDGRRLLAAGEGNAFHVFHAPNGRSIGSIPVQPPNEIFASTFTESGDFYAAGFDYFYHYDSERRQLHHYAKQRSNKNLIIEGAGGATIFSLQGKYQDYSYELTIDSLGVNGVGTQKINFFGTPKEVDYGPLAQVAYARVSPTVAFLVLGFTSGRVIFIETDARGDRFLPRNSDARKEFKSHQAAISDIAFSSDRRKLAIASYDGTISLWDLENYTNPAYQPVIFGRHPGWVLSVAFTPDGEHLVAGNQDGSLYFWNTDPGRYAEFLCDMLQETGSEAIQQQKRLESISRKSGLTRAFDELSQEDYRRYFGGVRRDRPTGSIRVCN